MKVFHLLVISVFTIISFLSLSADDLFALIYSYSTNGQYQYLGKATAGIGDFNGDGLDDFAASAPGAGNGEVYIYFGTTALAGPVMNVKIKNASLIYNDFGCSIAGNFDFNDDGYSDIVIGADSGAGKAYVFFGGCNPPSFVTTSSANISLTGLSAQSGFGFKVSRAGDVNGDGIGDMMISAPYYSTNTGRVYIYYGNKNPSPSPAPAVTLTGLNQYTYFGQSIAALGNIGGSVSDDIIVGAPFSSINQGNIYIYYGGCPEILMNNVYDLTKTGGIPGINNYGGTVAGLGDINGNGTKDFLVGDIFAGNCNGTSSDYPGKVYVYDGGAGLPLKTEIFGEPSTFFIGYFGAAAEGLGDIDGDGINDFMVGEYYYNTGKGRTYIFKSSVASTPGICGIRTWAPVISTCIGSAGNPANLLTYSDTTFSNPNLQDFIGYSVSNAGDVNGDGTPDYLYGAYGSDNDTLFDAGKVRLFTSTPVIGTKSFGKLDLTAFIQGSITAPCFQNLTRAQVWLYDNACNFVDKKNIVLGFNGNAIDGDGTFNIKFTNLNPVTCAYLNSYIIAIKPLCNSTLKTFSSVQTNIVRGGTASYDFTSSNSQAFGNKEIAVGCHKFGLYSGDVNENGVIDLSDVLISYNDASAFVPVGCCTRSNVNGDGVVDLSDVLICYNNANNFISSSSPCGETCF